ncbi:hypothetical protein PC120_g18222 [Phytophthora cactorum]|nr:hypothetical protein PC120_g18222 [Phytophthora cactorum]
MPFKHCERTMKREASLLTPKSETACAFTFCLSTEAAIASWTNRITACRRWTKSIACVLNGLFSTAFVPAAAPACALHRRVGLGRGVFLSVVSFPERDAACLCVVIADIVSVSALFCGCSDATVDPPPLKEEATVPSMLGRLTCKPK